MSTKKESTKKTKKDDEPIAGEIIEVKTEKPEDAELKELAKTDEPSREAALSIVGGVTTEELTKALEIQTEQRQLIQQFIKDNLVEGIDYGRIHVVKKEQCNKGDRCTIDYHFSKSILFKPGQEKIFSLFGITDELEKDDKAYEMLGNVTGMVAFKCVMYRGDKRIGEGRGAATLSQSQNDPNSTIKKAEKRARMDACLSLGFSAYFTQDLDDPEYKAQRDIMNDKAAREAEEIEKDENGFLPRDPNALIDNNERLTLHRLITNAGYEDQDMILELLRANGIEDPKTMTSGQARSLITKMKATDFMAPAKPEAAPEPEEALIVPPPPPAPVPAAELIVDDDLKSNTKELFETIGFNHIGRMWYMKQVSGKPFGSWEKFEELDWKRAYTLLMDILDGNIKPAEEHIAEKKAPVVGTPAPEKVPAQKLSPEELAKAQAVLGGAEVIG